MSQLAYLATKLDSMPEGDGTVLDNSCLMFLSNMWIGRKHDNTRLPLVLAGGLGGTLQTGRTLNYLDAGEDNRKMCSLYLSIMDRMGMKAREVRRRPDAARTAIAGLTVPAHPLRARPARCLPRKPANPGGPPGFRWWPRKFLP